MSTQHGDTLAADYAEAGSGWREQQRDKSFAEMALFEKLDHLMDRIGALEAHRFAQEAEKRADPTWTAAYKSGALRGILERLERVEALGAGLDRLEEVVDRRLGAVTNQQLDLARRVEVAERELGQFRMLDRRVAELAQSQYGYEDHEDQIGKVQALVNGIERRVAEIERANPPRTFKFLDIENREVVSYAELARLRRVEEAARAFVDGWSVGKHCSTEIQCLGAALDSEPKR